MKTHTIDQYISAEILLCKELRTSLKDTYEKQRMSSLYQMFFVMGSGLEWVKDSDGLYRRLYILGDLEVNSKKSSQEIYKKVSAYFSDKAKMRARYFSDPKEAAMIQMRDLMAQFFGTYKKDMSHHDPYIFGGYPQYLYFCFEPNDLQKGVDLNLIHPEYKEALKEIITYILNNPETLIYPLESDQDKIQRDLNNQDQLLQNYKNLLEAL